MRFPVFNYPSELEKKLVLDRPVLDRISFDIQTTTFPTWMVPPPKGLGHKSTGKLSADQWRVLATVCLVLTLVQLWMIDGTPHEQKMLDNFLELVTAIKYATKRSVTEQDIQTVETSLPRYLQGILDLYPDTKLVPNHHLSLHLPQFLRRLGPVHGWWAFAFERFNGIIQRFNTNNRFGETHSHRAY